MLHAVTTVCAECVALRKRIPVLNAACPSVFPGLNPHEFALVLRSSLASSDEVDRQSVAQPVAAHTRNLVY